MAKKDLDFFLEIEEENMDILKRNETRKFEMMGKNNYNSTPPNKEAIAYYKYKDKKDREEINKHFAANNTKLQLTDRWDRFKKKHGLVLNKNNSVARFLKKLSRKLKFNKK